VELTTVNQFLYQTGKRSAERMLQLLGGATDVPRFERLELEVVIRNTTTPFAARRHHPQEVIDQPQQ
jgi:DNA-binding LacI/PurR family transcriptional regulator